MPYPLGIRARLRENGRDMEATADLRDRLTGISLRDEKRLSRRLSRPGVEAEIVEAEARVHARRAAVPTITYPEHLPVSERRAEIADALRQHQVVVLAGETGSGKTTQLPKICLEARRGVRGMIGHTQPRRIAARAVAERVAEELGSPLGEDVGYTVRFHDQVSLGTYVKVMTDGILLAEIARDPDLLAYDTLIVDEAHERSLTIDYLLGYLTRLLPRRPDLKLVITSATIDPQRFADHFSEHLGAFVPVIEVSGRTYPVEVRYRPRVDDRDNPDTDQVSAIVAAVDELSHEPPGDVLVFLSGEREIRDAAEALRNAEPALEVLPLYARLSAAEQHKVFAPHRGRRVVLATNVAETSLTVPGIRYVVDPGTARISRYSQRTKVQRLPIEAISQASATQRSGRCGRVAAGVAIRLYSEEDFEARPAFTEPEILRTNLASVILSMTSLGLGEVANFPFLSPPESRNVRDGVALLTELGAVKDGRLTPVGRRLAELPVDPRLARMLVEADRLGCLRELFVLASALSIQDVRERPQEQAQKATELHNRFKDETSDFLTLLNLWEHLREQQQVMGSSAFRRSCKAELINHLRVREWQDLHHQLQRSARRLGMTAGSGRATDDTVHQAVLAGMLSHVGLRDEAARDYLGTRGARFAVTRESVVAKKPPRWVVAGELVETNRLWGRMLAKIQPEWVEQLAGDLVVRSYSEPHWNSKRGNVQASERVTLYGLPLVVGRRVDYSRVDPVATREILIQHALVEGDWKTHHSFLADNRRLLADVGELEQRARRRDLVVGDADVFAFYDARLPADIVSGAHLEAWWKKEKHVRPDLLTMTLPMLLHEGADVQPGDYPDTWVQGELRLALTYVFDPGAVDDGVTVHVPLPVLNRLSSQGFDWQVPGLRQELVTALIKALPKPLRVKLVPAPDTARAVLARLEPRSGSLLTAFADEAHALTRVDVRADDIDLARVPDHLRLTFRVFAGTETVADGKDLDALKARLGLRVQEAVTQAAAGLEQTGLTAWTVGTLPEQVRTGDVIGYPALVDEGRTVALRVLTNPGKQAASHRTGVRRLLLLNVPSPLRATADRLTVRDKLALAASPHGSVGALLDDCLRAAADNLMTSVPRDQAGFDALLSSVRGQLPTAVADLVAQVLPVLAEAQTVRGRLDDERRPPLAGSVDDMRAQLDALLPPGFVSEVGAARLTDLRRWVKGIGVRLDKLVSDPVRDRREQARFEQVADEWRRLPASPGRDEVRWMLEELRLSLFAQSIRTRGPVSEKRVYQAIDALAT